MRVLVEGSVYSRTSGPCRIPITNFAIEPNVDVEDVLAAVSVGSNILTILGVGGKAIANRITGTERYPNLVIVVISLLIKKSSLYKYTLLLRPTSLTFCRWLPTRGPKSAAGILGLRDSPRKGEFHEHP